MNDFKSKRRLTSEIINELKQNGEEEQKADRRKCIYKYMWLYKIQNGLDDSKVGQNWQPLTWKKEHIISSTIALLREKVITLKAPDIFY